MFKEFKNELMASIVVFFIALNAYYMKDIITKENVLSVHHLVLAEEVSFFNKASINQALDAILPYSKVVIDYSNSKPITYDVVKYIRDYRVKAKPKNIAV